MDLQRVKRRWLERKALRWWRRARVNEAMKADIAENPGIYEAWPTRMSAVAIPGMMVPAMLPVFLMAPEWMGVGFIPGAVFLALSLQGNRLPYALRVLRGKVQTGGSTQAPADLGELRAESIEGER